MRMLAIVAALAVAILAAASVIPMAYQGVPDLAIPEEAAAESGFSAPSHSEASVESLGVFTENIGQARNSEIILYSASGGAAFMNGSVMMYLADNSDPDAARAAAVRFTFEGSNNVTPVGENPAPWKTNYMLGRDPAKWHRNITNFRAVVYRNLWDGIDLTYRLVNGSLKYDIAVAPFADHRSIAIRVYGHEAISLNGEGAVAIGLGGGLSLSDSGLDVHYAGSDAERIAARFVLTGDCTYSFEIDGRDIARAIVIDPLVYSAFLGGAGADTGEGIAVGGDGSVYLAGCTESLNFTTTPGILADGTSPDQNIFLSKIDPTGSSLLYVTYLGGSGYDSANAVAADSEGCAYLAGVTYSADFPATAGAADTVYGGVGDAFAAKLNAEGNDIAYCTFLGGTHDEEAHGIAVDSTGQAYITGHTWSADFPVTTGAYGPQSGGDSDAFVCKLSTHGDFMIYSTYLGGPGSDSGAGITLSGGTACVAGTTASAGFPAGQSQPDHSGAFRDIFAAKLNSQGGGLEYSARLGGSGNDTARGIASDAEGRLYILGETDSADFPVSAGALSQAGGGTDLSVVCLDPSAGSLIYSACFGGALDEAAGGIAVDSECSVHVTGHTLSAGFPLSQDAEDSLLGGGSDGFMAKLDSDGSALLHSTFLGGSAGDACTGAAVSHDGCLVAVGQTQSADFPATVSAAQSAFDGGTDAFVVKYDITAPTAVAGPNITVNESSTVRFDGSSSRDNVAVTNYSWTVANDTASFNLTGAGPEHFFRYPGNYTVTLEVRDAVGNTGTDRINLTVLVYPIPIADAGNDLTVGASGLAVLDGSASRDNEAVVMHSWTFSDGTNSNITLFQESPAWSFAVPGVYEAALTVYDEDGNSDTDWMNITVTDTSPPKAVPGPGIETAAGSAVTFDGSASEDDVGIANYTWAFQHNGTQVTLYGQNATFAMWSPGTTEVTLTVTDAGGNADTNVMAVTVLESQPGTGSPTWAGAALLVAALALLGALAARPGLGRPRSSVTEKPDGGADSREDEA